MHAPVIADDRLLRAGLLAGMQHVVVECRVGVRGESSGECEAGDELFHVYSVHFSEADWSARFSSECPVSCQWIMGTGIKPAPFTSSK